MEFTTSKNCQHSSLHTLVMSFPLFLRSNNMGLHFSLAMLQVSTNETYFTLSFINFQKFLIHTQPPSPLSPFSVFSSYRWKFRAFRVAGSCPSSEETNKEVCYDTVLEYQPIGYDLLAKTPEGDRKRGSPRKTRCRRDSHIARESLQHGCHVLRWPARWLMGNLAKRSLWPSQEVGKRMRCLSDRVNTSSPPPPLTEGWQLSGHLGNARQKGNFPFQLQTRVVKQYSSSRNLEPMSTVNFSEGQTPLYIYIFFLNLTCLRVSAGMTGW